MRSTHRSRATRAVQQSGGRRGHAGGLFGAPPAVRKAVFLLLALTAAGGAAALLWPRSGGSWEADQTIEITMAGFSQPVLLARAGKPLRLQIVNPDSPYHTDGGGWHQLAIPALKVDVRVPPRSARVVEIPPAPAGEYGFYCDVCCGGKANPSMRGVLRVEA
ncbi:MAG: cupredoxin domain-containing protein [Armatimonadota bacterium]|nr:cupredoxin domain-containing protein [Armatimonadota bacterium]MDR7564020.1 cupredoxin domain-containing protein [Armatimonadota bacterium]MDR7568778.1 cupredoxin domain-containing protein [Armatimonadota bacterium]MDR7602940.1 cupredoxin domain-containing protein [Armatimonadota bacterium]